MMKARTVLFEPEFDQAREAIHGTKRGGATAGKRRRAKVPNTIILSLKSIALAAASLFISIPTMAISPSLVIDNQPVNQIQKSTRTIDDLTRLKPNWNGYGAPAPNHSAANNAKIIVSHASSFHVDQISASAEGGISLYWFGRELIEGGAHRKYAWIECDNDGGIAVLTCDRLNDNPMARDVDLKDATRVLRELRQFIQGA